MENSKSSFVKLLAWAVIGINVIFVLWILYNGINEGFQGKRIEKISYITLMGLLATNAFLLINKYGKQPNIG